MGDHEDRLAFPAELVEQRHEVLGSPRIQVARRLVREQQRRRRHEGARDRDALALTAGKLVRSVLHPVAQPQATQQFGTPAPRFSLRVVILREPERQQDVFKRGHSRQEVEALKDETDIAVAQARKLLIVHAGHRLAEQAVLAEIRSVQTPEYVHQGRLARTRRPHHGYEVSALDLDIDVIERVHPRFADLESAAQTRCRNDADHCARAIPYRNGTGSNCVSVRPITASDPAWSASTWAPERGRMWVL